MFWQLDGLAGRGAVWGGAEVLDWPAYGEAQIAGYGEGPVRLAEEFAGEDDNIGFVAIQDGIGLTGAGDHAYRAGENSGALANLVGEGNLVARANGNLRSRNHAAGGAINQVHTERAEKLSKRDGLLEIPAAGDPISGGDAHE